MATLSTLEGETKTEYEVDEFEEEITCAVCQEHFQDPKILPCCHYYCKRCVQLLIDNARSHEKNSFPCPECRKDTTIANDNPDRLPTAFFVNRMKALYTKREKTQGKVKARCEQCSTSEEDAIAFCRQCAEFICGRCMEAHKRMKAFSSHRVATLEELKEGSSKQLPAEKAPPSPACSVHEEPMKIFCYDCETLICRDCIVIDHKRHKYDFVKKVTPGVKEKLGQEIIPLKKVHKSLKSALKTVEVTKSKVEMSGTSLSVSITRSFQKLHNIIEQRKEELLMQTSKLVDTKFDRLSLQEKQLQHTMHTVQSMVDFVERSIENMTDEELISIHLQILKQVGEETKNLEALTVDLRPVEEADTTFEMSCTDEIQKLCREKIKVHASSNRKVVWVDPRINNHENSTYIRYLKTVEGVSLHATTSASDALDVLLVRDPKTEYRAITAGTGGKEFIERLRANGIHCPVLVFCGNFSWHSKWARKFENVEVTVDTSRMYEFATWERL